MPWILSPATHDHRMLSWAPIDENGEPDDAAHKYITEVHQDGAVVIYKDTYESDYSPPESMLPLHFRQSTNHSGYRLTIKCCQILCLEVAVQYMSAKRCAH